ncbi:unnamed protein product [Blepharisma stoltei]|uniref:MARVEL domain-containing protein n=1 Tax=Blepharisma stoltei TaxID=1481888 RepID=A0AAU9JBM6_9CILI|nr:unnamed protein product [Blepharisma stoltei]
MEDPKGSELSRHGRLTRFLLILLGLCGLTLMIVTISVLTSTDDNCDDSPLREWLIALAVILGVASIPTILTEIFCGHSLENKLFRNCYHTILAIETILYFLWMAVGTYLIMDDDSCNDKFEDGYDLAFFLFGVSYIGASVIVLVLAIGLLSKPELYKAGYNPIP